MSDTRNDPAIPANQDLLSAANRGNVPTPQASGQPDATVDLPFEKRCYTVEDLQVIRSSSRSLCAAWVSRRILPMHLCSWHLTKHPISRALCSV